MRNILKKREKHEKRGKTPLKQKLDKKDKLILMTNKEKGIGAFTFLTYKEKGINDLPDRGILVE